MNQLRTMLRMAAPIVVVAAVAGLTGCDDRFRSVDKSPPRVERVMAYDNTNLTNQPVVVENPGANAVLAGVPTMLGAVRVDFNKPMDGATIQKNGGEPLCEASSNITVTKTPAAGTPTDITQSAQVCYIPAGSNANLTAILEGSPTCAGPDPNVPANGGPIGLEPGATYVITGNGVSDQSGNKINFTVTVTAADFVASNATVVTGFGAATLATAGLQFAEDATTDLAGATGVPIGNPDPATSLYTGPTATLGVSRLQTSKGVFYGTPIDVHFTGGPMCPNTLEGLCVGSAVSPGPVTLAVASDPTHSVDVGAVGDDADGLVQHVVPRLPLENSQTYQLTVKGSDLVTDPANPVPGWLDVNNFLNSGTGTTAGFTAAFTTEQGAPRVVWQYPLPAATGNYATVDQTAIQQWTGQLMVGIATSTPLTGTPSVTLSPATAGVAQGFGEGRNRSLTFTTTDKLPLANDTDYTVSWSGLASASGPLAAPGGTFTFHTLPFGQDPNFPGFANFLVKYTTSSSSARASYLRVGQGNVFPALTGAPIAYFTTATGKAQHGSTVVGTYQAPGRTQADAFTFLNLTGGSVHLFEGKPDANVNVPGVGGYAQVGITTPTDPWDSGYHYPGSLIGFLPSGVLKSNQLYTLVANVIPVGGSQAVTITLPFTTVPFRVPLALDASQAFDLSTGPVEVTFDDANPLIIRTTTKLDPSVLVTPAAPPAPPPPGTTTGPVQMVKSDGTKVPIHLEDNGDASRGLGMWFNVVPDPGVIEPSTTYTLVVTNELKSSLGETITPTTFTFTTAPAVDPVTNALVCK